MKAVVLALALNIKAIVNCFSRALQLVFGFNQSTALLISSEFI